MQRIRSIVAASIALVSVAAPAVSDELETAEGKYQARLQQAHDAHNEAVKRAFEAHLRELADLFEKQSNSGNRQAAERLGHRIRDLKREGPPLIPETKDSPLQALMPRLTGHWVVTYTNKTQHTRDILENQLVNGRDELVQENGDLIIVFPDVIERVTLIDDTLFVEHFNPSSTYPDGIPAVMGVGRKTKK